MEEATGTSVPRGVPLDMSCIGVQIKPLALIFTDECQVPCEWERQSLRMLCLSDKVLELRCSLLADFE